MRDQRLGWKMFLNADRLALALPFGGEFGLLFIAGRNAAKRQEANAPTESYRLAGCEATPVR